MKVLITGGHGMVGTALSKKIYSICPTRKELDLENGEKVLSFLLEHKPDIVFHLAARVGGVLENSKYPADFYSCVPSWSAHQPRSVLDGIHPSTHSI